MKTYAGEVQSRSRRNPFHLNKGEANRHSRRNLDVEKSVTAQSIMRFDFQCLQEKIKSGSILFNGKDLAKCSEKKDGSY